MSDLADLVCDHMAAHAHDDTGHGFTVSQHTEINDDVAVTFRPGFIDAQPAVLAQTLHPWTDSLRDAGFVVAVEYAWPDQPEPAPRENGARVALWLHITGHRPVSP